MFFTAPFRPIRKELESSMYNNKAKRGSCASSICLVQVVLSHGQTESQVDVTPFGPALSVLTVDLRWLSLTLVKIKFARKSKEFFHRLAT